MAKSIVETTGNFMLRSSQTGDEIHWNRPSVVRHCGFVGQKVGDGQVKVLAGGLPDTVSDTEWVEWLKAADGNVALAVESFVSQFSDVGRKT